MPPLLPSGQTFHLCPAPRLHLQWPRPRRFRLSGGLLRQRQHQLPGLLSEPSPQLHPPGPSRPLRLPSPFLHQPHPQQSEGQLLPGRTGEGHLRFGRTGRDYFRSRRRKIPRPDAATPTRSPSEARERGGHLKFRSPLDCRGSSSSSSSPPLLLQRPPVTPKKSR